MGRWMDELRVLQAVPEPVAAGFSSSVVATPKPIPPIRPGWLVAYRDRNGALCGGCDDRQQGTVHECQWIGMAWIVLLTDGQRLSLTSIRSVGKTDSGGKIVAAWCVREHGYDGMKKERLTDSSS